MVSYIRYLKKDVDLNFIFFYGYREIILIRNFYKLLGRFYKLFVIVVIVIFCEFIFIYIYFS